MSKIHNSNTSGMHDACKKKEKGEKQKNVQCIYNIHEPYMNLIRKNFPITNPCDIDIQHEKSNTLKILYYKESAYGKKSEILDFLNRIREVQLELSPEQATFFQTQTGKIILQNHLGVEDVNQCIHEDKIIFLSEDKDEEEMETILQKLRSDIQMRLVIKVSNEFELSYVPQSQNKEGQLVKKTEIKGKSSKLIIVEGYKDHVIEAEEEIKAIRPVTFRVEGARASYLQTGQSAYELYSYFHPYKYITKPEKGFLHLTVYCPESEVEKLKDKFFSQIEDKKLDCQFKSKEMFIIFKAMELKYKSVTSKIEQFQQENDCDLEFNSTSTMNEKSEEIVEKISKNITLTIRKNEDITQQSADVLVCPIEKDIDRKTGVRSSFSNSCPNIEDELISQVKSNPDQRIFTIKNNLGKIKKAGVIAVIYVMLEKYNSKNPEKSKTDLEKKIVQVFKQANVLKAKSITFPVMGSKKGFLFPEHLSAKAVLDAVHLATSKKNDSRINAITLFTPPHSFDIYKSLLLERLELERFRGQICYRGKGDHKVIEKTLRELLQGICFFQEKIAKSKIENFHKEIEEELVTQAKEKAVDLRCTIDALEITGPEEGRKEFKNLIKKKTSENKDSHIEKVIEIKAQRRTKEFVDKALSILNNQDKSDSSPPHWKSVHSTQQREKFDVHDVDTNTHLAIEGMIERLWKKSMHHVGKGHDADGLKHKTIKVKKVQQIENVKLFKSYRFKKKILLQKYAKDGAVTEVNKLHHDLVDKDGTKINIKSTGPVKTSLELDDQFKLERDLLSEEINEHYLLHGCKADTVDHIIQQGLDKRVANEAGMFGQGVYFAEDPVKSDQYAGGFYTYWYIYIQFYNFENTEI